MVERMPGQKMFFTPRIFRSPWAVPIWKDRNARDILSAQRTHPRSYLSALREQGYDSVWLNCRFRDAVPSKLFPRVGDKPLAALGRFVEHAGRCGIRVFLLLHEPQGFPADDPFWRKHPDLRGHTLPCLESSLPGAFCSLCSSTPAVQEYLEEGAYKLFRSAPGLGGVIMITASEYPSHCYSHYPIRQKQFTDPNIARWAEAPFTCPRCRDRSPVDVVSELIALVRGGARRAAPDAEIIAHTWSWYILEPDPQPALIGRLPADVILLSDWERGGAKEVCGRRYPVDEYSFSYTGPSPRFKAHLRLAKRRGIRMMAKIQTNVTHELASVPYLPLPHALAKTMTRMRRLGVSSYLASAPFGGNLSPMSALAGMMSRAPQLSASLAVRRLAAQEYGGAAASAVCHAWRRFYQAWRHYPFSIPFLYYSPLNYALAWPLSLRAQRVSSIAGYQPLPRDGKGFLKVGDNLETWLKPFGPRIALRALQAMHREWQEGVDILTDAAKLEPENKPLQRELGLARHIGLSIESVAHIIRFYVALRRRSRETESVRGILQAELNATREDLPLVIADARLGFHPEAQTRLYSPLDLKHRIAVIKESLRKLDQKG
jgi:hypothetical protein